MLWESQIPINQIFELRCRTIDYFGVGAINKFYDIAKDLKENRGISRVILVTGKSSYKKCGAWDVVKPALEENGIEYVHYDKVGPNPTVDMVDEAAQMGKEFGAQAVIGIGGGSPIDTAKSVAILLEYTDKTARELYKLQFSPRKAKPIIAINTTHGTGTEVNRFAVASILEEEYKPAIAYDCIYPLYSIDDPTLMTKLPADQTRYVTIDALNHVNEAATTKVASPYSILLAKETARLIFDYLPEALIHPDNLQAKYYLLYASAIAGISFDNGLLHFTHALEHPLSAVKPDLPHGLGLAILLPAVIKHIYPATARILAEIYRPLVPEVKGVPGEAELVAKKVEEWLFAIGITQKLTDVGFSEDDVKRLTELAMTTPSLNLLLSLAPVEATKETIEAIYRDSLYPLSK
ncbi:iron-containing alcohol dehydrogenase [Thermococcus paralvinellae]|uniref:Iron alcohol dehydrogenase n=1 Tax=Thermococcus paralvinellae TaxID=582419 RepID=W0I2U2_9EURY|nr:iron-containing alcohol dehydrogenase [Thermococcus paralvinellae]AHF80371.1 iron alcohol dehydrogenase [Thermococcus paralvinellae]AUE21777.1 AdhA [Cloning vector pCBcth4]